MVMEKVVLFFDDGDRVSRKIGEIKSLHNDFLFFDEKEGEEQIIPTDRIVRIKERSQKTEVSK